MILAARTFQLACAALAAFVVTRPTPPPPEPEAVAFTLSLVGEREARDGSWTGVDLLNEKAPIDRFQVVLRPSQNVRAHLEAIDDDGPQRLYPGPLEKSPLLVKGRNYAFPGPNSFFEIAGKARLRLVVIPETLGDGAPAQVSPALATTRERPTTYKLTDGAPASVVERRFEGHGATALELDVTSG